MLALAKPFFEHASLVFSDVIYLALLLGTTLETFLSEKLTPMHREEPHPLDLRSLQPIRKVAIFQTNSINKNPTIEERHAGGAPRKPQKIGKPERENLLVSQQELIFLYQALTFSKYLDALQRGYLLSEEPTLPCHS